jgi:uncharacterized RDD family membrane protein YckC
VICYVWYQAYFLGSDWQATSGKRLCGIYVRRESGDRVTAWLGLGRYFSYFLSVLPIGIGFLMIAWDSHKRGLHDFLCGTRVVYGRC